MRVTSTTDGVVMNPINKPAWKTTEFWISVMGVLSTLFVTSGVLDPASADQVNEASIKLVIAIANAMQVGIYVYSRQSLKLQHAKLVAENPDYCSVCGQALKKEVPTKNG